VLTPNTGLGLQSSTDSAGLVFFSLGLGLRGLVNICISSSAQLHVSNVRINFRYCSCWIQSKSRLFVARNV